MSHISLQPGDKLALTIETLVHSGEGLARHEGLPVFVPGTFPGDQLQAQVISRKPGYARALIQALELPSKERVTPPCPVTATCGGCQWQEYDYLAQLRAKSALLQETLIRVGQLDPLQVVNAAEPPLGMEDPFGYRNKAQFPLTMRDGTLEGGFYAPHSHLLVPRDRCDIQHPAINQAYAHALEGLRATGIQAYDEDTGMGALRHLVIRHGAGTGETLVGIVSARPSLDLEAWVEHMQCLPGLAGLLFNYQPKPGNTILGPETRLLWGRDHLFEQLGGLTFKISLPSFFQVNPTQMAVLYDTVKAYAALSGNEIVLDTYAGAGTIGLWLAPWAQRIDCLEVVPAAIRDGQENAVRNGFAHLVFHTGKVEHLLPQVLRQGQPDVIILDPPRKGCEPSVIEAVGKSQVERVVYVSCNPATLARDLGLLEKQGYILQRYRPVDMFPHTHHLETVALLTRKA